MSWGRKRRVARISGLIQLHESYRDVVSQAVSDDQFEMALMILTNSRHLERLGSLADMDSGSQASVTARGSFVYSAVWIEIPGRAYTQCQAAFCEDMRRLRSFSGPPTQWVGLQLISRSWRRATQLAESHRAALVEADQKK